MRIVPILRATRGLDSSMSVPNPAAVQLLEATLFGEESNGLPSKFTAAMILTMLDAGAGISDLIFSPGRPPQIEQHGELNAVAIPGLPVLQPQHTSGVARELIGGSEQALKTL